MMTYAEIVKGILGSKWIKTLDQYLDDLIEEGRTRDEAIAHIEKQMPHSNARFTDNEKQKMLATRRLAAWVAAHKSTPTKD